MIWLVKLYYFVRWPLFVGAVFGLLVGNIVAMQRLSKISEEHKQQSDQALDQAKQSAENMQAQTDRIINYMNCIVQFFSQPDRDNLVIQSVEECVLEREATTPPTLQPNNPAPRPATQSGQAQSVDPSGNNEANGGDKQSLPERAIKLVCDKLKPIGVC